MRNLLTDCMGTLVCPKCGRFHGYCSEISKQGWTIPKFEIYRNSRVWREATKKINNDKDKMFHAPDGYYISSVSPSHYFPILRIFVREI